MKHVGMRAAAAAAVISVTLVTLSAQRGGGAAPAAPPPTPRAGALIDLTGHWVSLVTEDWRYRSSRRPRATTSPCRSTPTARRWPTRGTRRRTRRPASSARPTAPRGSCGCPGRLRITWQDDTTLKIETDAGTQTRICGSAAQGEAGELAGRIGGVVGVSARGPRARFAGSAAARRSWRHDEGRDDADAARLPATNGVPYSANAVMTEYFDRLEVPGGDTLSSWRRKSSIPSTWGHPTGRARSSSGRPMRAAGIRRRARPVEGDTMTNVRRLCVRRGLAALAERDFARDGPAVAQGQVPAAPAATNAPSGPAIDLTGYWTPTCTKTAMERGAGPELADYGGFALNEAGRLWALSYDPSRVTLRHHQCEGYVDAVPDALDRQLPHLGRPRSAHAAADRHSLVGADHRRAPRRSGWTDVRTRRPGRRTPARGSPPDRFVGNALVVQTTHLKQGWLRRNGCPRAIRRR